MTDENKALTQEVRSRISDALEVAFSKEPEEMLLQVERDLQGLQGAPDDDPSYRLALESAWFLAQSINVHFKAGKFAEAVEPLERAAQGFNSLGQQHPRDLTLALGAYARCVVDIGAMNYTQALERMRTVEQFLNGAGTFSNRYRRIVDQMKPEQLLIAAMMSLNQLDMATSRALIEEAVAAAGQVALTYYAEGSPGRSIWTGYAHLYRANFDMQRLVSATYQFDYDRVIAEGAQVIANAKTAADLLRPHGHESAPVRMAAIQADGLSQFLDTLPELANLMKKVFDATLTRELPGVRVLRERMDRAGQSIATAGPRALALVRYIEQVTNLVRNLERLARPTKKDFGIYSGLVTAVAFMVVFFGTSWANWLFDLGVDSTKLMTTSALVALIAGFGFGALRFKSLFVPSARKEPE